MAIGRWQDAHEESTHGLNSDLREKLLKKQYKAEKNVWMSVRSSHPFVPFLAKDSLRGVWVVRAGVCVHAVHHDPQVAA